jgi:hypothetical protein
VNRQEPRLRILRPTVAALLILLTGCAAEEAMGQPSYGVRDESGGGGEHQIAKASLFISPSGEPFRAGPGEPYPVVRWFAQADRNGDGRLDRAEFRVDAEIFFKLLDKNHDGIIDGFELSDYEHDRVPEILGAYRVAPGQSGSVRGGDHRGRSGGGGAGGRGSRASNDADGGAVVMGGAVPYELLAEPEPVASADSNLTGRVTLADFLIAADRRFALLDTKGQGSLTLADLPKTPVQQAAEGKPAHRKN